MMAEVWSKKGIVNEILPVNGKSILILSLGAKQWVRPDCQSKEIVLLWESDEELITGDSVQVIYQPEKLTIEDQEVDGKINKLIQLDIDLIESLNWPVPGGP